MQFAKIFNATKMVQMLFNMKNFLMIGTSDHDIIHIYCYDGDVSRRLVEKERIIILGLLITHGE